MDFNSPQSVQGIAQVLSGQTAESTDLNHRLNVYQVFARLYDQHQGLLKDILDLEHLNGVCETPQGKRLVPHYVIALLEGSIPCLLTNLLDHQTLRLYQPQGIWLVGRSEDASISLGDRLLSRYHAAIQYGPQGFELVDLKSTNGSYINSERLSHRQVLREGDRIRLGGVTFTFHDASANILQARILPAIGAELQKNLGLRVADLFNPPTLGNVVVPPRSSVEDTMTFLNDDDVEDEVGMSSEQKQSVLDRLKHKYHLD